MRLAADGAERRLACCQRVADGGGHLDGIAVAADMHVERRGARAQQVIVNGGDLEPALDQLRHDRIDLGFQQHEVAHHHGLAMHRLERDPAAERQRRLDGDAVERHGEIGARKSIAMHVAGDGRLPAEDLVDLLPVDCLGVGARDERFGEDLPVDGLRIRA